MATRRAPRPRKKPSKPAKRQRIRVRIEVPALTKEQRAVLEEVFGVARVSIQGLPPPIGIVKQALVKRRRKK